ncbi:hypothetical protein B0T16DRAFT_410123 [Cercophora newfieldiana]|uniref:Uncharacterized protein n=1 Tax=Cercophora newfieldiana TaxID=92897 RepID=A0AA39YBG5_9PEZI|nr:hypothetical protein B0T16DRAFT_410123 [Cercophora newfieldiana]
MVLSFKLRFGLTGGSLARLSVRLPSTPTSEVGFRLSLSRRAAKKTKLNAQAAVPDTAKTYRSVHRAAARRDTCSEEEEQKSTSL